ncbi:MAG: Holliday junction branch migration protein RuvA [Syntrophobacteria bacterium]
MIAHIQGRLHFKSPEYVIVDVRGIGYKIRVPLTTFYDLPEAGDTVALHIHTHVREDAMELYGFQSREEKELFVRLISVAGIGPRLAIAILSGINPTELVSTVGQRDIARLTSIPGVGRKTAERIVIELIDKLPALAPGQDVAEVPQKDEETVVEDALSALLNLGYKKAVAERAIDRARKQLKETATLETLLKESLRSLA